MKIILILVSFSALSQYNYQETKLLEDVVINGTSTEGQGAFAISTGASIQVKIDCTTCIVETKIFSSIDNEDYAEITDLTKTFTAPTTALFNIYGQFFKYFKIKITETSGTNATINASYSTKSAL